MAKMGRPATPLFELTATQEEFYAYCVEQLLGGSLKSIPSDPKQAFRAGVAMGRQYAKFAESRKLV